MRGNVSSQYLTALLMLAPTIASEEGFWIDIKGELISRPYVEMTVRMMRDFGIEARETATGFWVRAEHTALGRLIVWKPMLRLQATFWPWGRLRGAL